MTEFPQRDEEIMRRKAIPTPMDAGSPKTVETLAEKVAADPDRQLFVMRAKEPLEDCLAAIERRIGHI